MVQGQGNGIGLYGIINHTVGNGNQNSKESSPDTVAEAVFQIISRAAAEAVTVFSWHLIKLGQGRFHKARGRTDDRNKPHPENSAGTAGYDGNSDACNVAYTYSGSSADTESLERRNLISLGLPAGRMGYELEHPSEVTNLYSPGSDSKIEACSHQQGDDNR